VASTPKAGGTESRPRSRHRWYERAITYLYLIRKDIYRGYRDRSGPDLGFVGWATALLGAVAHPDRSRRLTAWVRSHRLPRPDMPQVPCAMRLCPPYAKEIHNGRGS
jgi:hypothetical protein